MDIEDYKKASMILKKIENLETAKRYIYDQEKIDKGEISIYSSGYFKVDVDIELLLDIVETIEEYRSKLEEELERL